jgi:putative oxidoreductase
MNASQSTNHRGGDMSKGKTVALWVVSVLLAAMFMFSGAIKLLKPADVKPMFVHYGYAAWFATLIGICEALGGLGLLIPRLGGLAASGLAIIMVGAFFTHATHHEMSHAMVPLVLFVLLVIVAYTRFKHPSGDKAMSAAGR